MAFLLRQLEKKNIWIAPSISAVRADALGLDLRTKDDRLSVWRIQDDKANLDRVVAAICAGRDNPSNFDFVLLQESVVRLISPLDDTAAGVTPDNHANTSWHQDLSALTLAKINQLANCIFSTERDRISGKVVKRLIEQAVASGWLDRARIKKELLPKLSL